MSHLPQLNYTTLGNRDVFPLDLSSFLDHDILIGTALRRIGEDLPDPTKPLELEIWLVCGDTTPDLDRRLICLPVEKDDPLRTI